MSGNFNPFFRNDGLSRKKRLSQRQPLACRACTKSKVRCDKNVPCARCRRRNTPCEREAVELSAKKPRKSTSLDEQRSLPVPHFYPAKIHDRTDVAAYAAASRPALYSPLSPVRVGSAIQVCRSKDCSRSEENTSQSQVKFEDLATCIEGLAWGRHQCHKYPHRDCVRFDAPRINPTPNVLSTPLVDKMPDVETARQMVDFHVRMLAWNHNVLHVSTFVDQCTSFWSSGRVEDGQWLALYCAVLSASAWSICNSADWQGRLGELHTRHSPNDLFALVNTILAEEDFMGRHTIFSLQAICISGMVANVLGKSDRLATWINAGIRVAQCLGLHHIGSDIPGEPFHDVLDKEVGRRVWWKLVELDYHSIPYTGTYSINTRHFTTKQPGNCDDDLLQKSETHLTTSTYALIKGEMALLIPTLLDGPNLGDAASRYDHVISVDRQMRELVASIPSAILRGQGENPLGPKWLTLARRTLAIAAADKIIMIHRSFLLKSFQSPAYLFTRQTCISAAMTILREHEELSLAGPDCPPIWLHSAFCVSAIVVICLDLLHCHTFMTTERRDKYMQLIRGARARLSVSKDDTMARRGVYLVDAMLNEELYTTTSQGISGEDSTRHRFSQILYRFIQLDQDEAQGPASMSRTRSGDQITGQQYDDFDVWFTSHFSRSPLLRILGRDYTAPHCISPDAHQIARHYHKDDMPISINYPLWEYLADQKLQFFVKIQSGSKQTATKMPHPVSPLQVWPLPSELRKSTLLGAEIILPESMTLFNPKLLSETEKETFRKGFFDNGVLVIRNQTGIEPQVLYEIADLLDPNHLPYHSGGQKQVTDHKNILSQNNCSRIPRAPQVTVIGSGKVEDCEGIDALDLKHLDQSSFHENPLSVEELSDGLTRPYRWHMDAALYESLPGIVTSLHAIEVPQVPDQKLQFSEGKTMNVAAGATLFFSGARNFEVLTPTEQEFALNTTVHYAPRAYEMIRNCKASADGLTIEQVGRETPIDQLPAWTPEKVHSFPMVWRNPSNNEPHLQIAGCCVYSLTTVDPHTGSKTVISDLAEVRQICRTLQSKVYQPENVYAHAWQKGDLVIFHNRGVMHSISGQLAQYEDRRLLWQCNMASSNPPQAYREIASFQPH